MGDTRLGSERALRRMNRAHGAALTILVLLVLAVHVTLADHITAIRSDARAINEAGLERMRVQRAALFAVRVATAPVTRRPVLRMALDHQARYIWEAWRALPSLRTDGLPQPRSVTEQIRRFVGWLRIVAAPVPGPASASATRAILAAAEGPLALALNQRVLAYQRLAEHDNTDLSELARDQFFLVLGALAALTLVIFVPLSRLTRAEIVKLTDAIAYNRTLFESAPDGIIVIDERGVIEAFNPAAEVLFGWPAKSACGRSVGILMAEPDRSRHGAYLERYLATGEHHVIGRLREVTAVRRDELPIPIEISVGAINGKRRRFVGIARDLTARKAAQEALDVVRRRYRDLVNNLNVGVFRIAAGAPPRFLEVNPAMLALFEAPTSVALLARPIDTLFADSKDQDIFSEDWDPGAHVLYQEVLLRTLEGREFWAMISAVRKDEVGEAYFDGIVEDVTARREAARALAALNQDLEQRVAALDIANKELEAFSYSVSHDLRAPLRSIDGFSQALLEDYADKVDAVGRDYLTRVRAASQKMAQLIDDLLQLSRVTRAQLVRKPVDITAMARDIAETLQTGAPGRCVKWRIAEGLKIGADPVLMRQVVANLLANAWKFTSKKTEARIEVGELWADGRRLLFVRDNGAGFDMAYADRLFGVFQRLHASGDFDGTGIGLAIVQRIVRRHGGDVRAEGTVGEGACFSFTIPDNEDLDVNDS
ncbi:PAS domain S-box protein [Acidiferrobacter sp.]|uniref:sensor histidine kinase n=1 Tax=Acidiferrobacter sp. TaxID=1872107 RepID=UPI0026016A61|nr:PAS domain S-box protein [Acidiferrobacter sp.]